MSSSPACPGHCPRSCLTYRDAFTFFPQQALAGHLLWDLQHVFAVLGRIKSTPGVGLECWGTSPGLGGLLSSRKKSFQYPDRGHFTGVPPGGKV